MAPTEATQHLYGVVFRFRFRAFRGDFEVRPPEPHADVHARVEVCGLFADGKSAQRWFGVRGDCLGVE